MLPSARDVLSYYYYMDCKLKSSKIAEKVVDIWQQYEIPTTSKRTITLKFENILRKFQNLKKYDRSRQGTAQYVDRLKHLQSTLTKLFDIARCKCSFERCLCSNCDKVPSRMVNFLQDQRTNRRQSCVTKLQQQFNCKHETIDSDEQITDVEHLENKENVIDYDDNDDEDQDYIIENKKCKESGNTNKNNNLKLKAFSVACDRVGVSDRGAAILASAILDDVGFINATNNNFVIDKSKVRRARENSRGKLQAEKVANISALYFDGRKDRTIQMDYNDGIPRRVKVIEEHICLVSEPGSKYVGHVTPKSGKATRIVEDIFDFMRREQIATDFVVAGCDGTNSNTGWKGGILTLMEEKLQRPLQWFICLLHMNELPLRHLIENLDGPTTGPTAFSGPIAQNLANSVKLPVINFKPISVDLPEVPSDISTDQKYLHDICTAVTTGYCSKSLAKRHPGNIRQSRWLTIANNLLRKYIGTERPSANFVTLVTYITKVYAPMWFAIKTKPKCVNGALHFWKLISLTRYLPPKIRQIVDPVIERNAYFAHPENVLLSMLNDKNPSIRNLALRRILDTRSQRPPNLKQIRKLRVPKINFSARSYDQMIDWNSMSEPPLTFQFSEERLRHFVDTGGISEEFNFPCHTQAVERHVKVISAHKVEKWFTFDFLFTASNGSFVESYQLEKARWRYSKHHFVTKQNARFSYEETISNSWYLR